MGFSVIVTVSEGSVTVSCPVVMCDGVVDIVWFGEVMNLVEIELPISKMSFDSRASPQTPWRRVRKFLPFFCTLYFLLYANGTFVFIRLLI